ncbi:MAG: hypothetical protein N2201_02775 [candidate division WOR-3 bacterium]|nr:hypothetical protein [candidate division WOR-3 bacterium]
MRRIILFIVLGVLVIFAFTRLFSRPKPTGGTKKKSSSDTLAVRSRRGKTAGQIKTKTKEELREEKRRAQRAERARLRELRRRQRELERMRRLSRRKRRIRSKRAKQIYVLRAIMKIDSEKYALIDTRRMTIGEEISGRKIVEIGDDRIVIEEFGRRREVRMGESILPSVLTQKRRR